MKYFIVKYGCINGLILFICFFASHLILGTSPDNFDISEIIGYSIMIVSSCAIIIGIKECKQHNNQQLSFWAGLGVGLGISSIASFFFAIYNLIYLKWINPDFTAIYIAHTDQQIRNSGLTEEQIQQQLAELNYYADLMHNDYLQSLLMFITVFLIGIVFSVITAAAMRTKTQ